jgi:hypothetical protein
MSKFESMKESQNITSKPKNGHGGSRPGAGFPKGQKKVKTLEKIAIQKALAERVMAKADILHNAQFSVAIGSTYIYRVEEEEDEKGKIKVRHVLVTEPDEIKMVLDETAGASGPVQGGYYIITTEKPDTRAIDSMLDRTFGRPTQTVVTEDEEGVKKPLEATVNIIKKYTNDN